jgi:hypothetical protein
MCGPCIRELWTDLGSFSFKDLFVPPSFIGCNVQFVWYLRFFSHQWGQDPFCDMKWTNLEVLAYRTNISSNLSRIQILAKKTRNETISSWIKEDQPNPLVDMVRMPSIFSSKTQSGLQGVARFYPRNWISWGGDHWQCMFPEFNFLVDHINYEVSCSTATTGPLPHFLHSMKLIWQLHYWVLK